MYLSFRTRQVLHDVCHELRKRPLSDFAALSLDQELLANLLESGLVPETDADLTLLQKASELFLEDAPLPARAFALSLVMADALSLNLLDWSPVGFLLDWADALDDATDRALCSALREIERPRLEPIQWSVFDDDCLSLTREQVCLPLQDFIQSATDEELWSVASGDSHSWPEQHFEPLKQVVREQRGVVGEGQHYFPAEAFELVSYDRGHPSWHFAMALVLLNALASKDTVGYASARWGGQGASIRALPAEQSRDLLQAFRYLFESDLSWEPMDDAAFGLPGLVPPIPVLDETWKPDPLDGH